MMMFGVKEGTRTVQRWIWDFSDWAPTPVLFGNFFFFAENA